VYFKNKEEAARGILKKKHLFIKKKTLTAVIVLNAVQFYTKVVAIDRARRVGYDTPLLRVDTAQ
jgi:hypothetical protein